MDATIHDGDLEEILPAWDSVFAADDRATPFQSPAWAHAWWRHWGGGSRPWLIAVRDEGRVVGLAPLRVRRIAGARVLRGFEEPGDYWDVLAVPELRPQVEEAVAREMLRRRGDWDAVVLSRLPHGSSTAAAVRSAGLRPVARFTTPCPAISLPGTFDAYLAMLSSKRRTTVRRRLRLLERGELALHEVTVGEVPVAAERWQRLRVRQWSQLGKRLMTEHTQPRFRAFLVDVATELLPAGLAVMWELEREGEVVGSFINFCDARAFYHYLGAYRPDLGQLSIGNVATAYGIRSSIEAGRAQYDFGRGSEPYKYWYGGVDRFSTTVVLAGGGVRSRAVSRALAVRPGG